MDGPGWTRWTGLTGGRADGADQVLVMVESMEWHPVGRPYDGLGSSVLVMIESMG